MTNGKIPPEWVKLNSKTRPEHSYFHNKIDGSSFWEGDIQFDDSGKVILSPTARQIGKPPQKSLQETKDSDSEESIDDEMIAKLFKPGQNKAQLMSPSLKRKHEESVATYQEDDRSNHSSKNRICSRKMVQIKRTSDQSNNALTKVKSKNSSLPNYPAKQLNIGTTKTPIQDRFEKKREQLLNSQEKSTDSRISLSSPKEELTPKRDIDKIKDIHKRKEETITRPQKSLNKTPIQDKYDQIKSILLKQQEQSNKKPQNGGVHKELKRKSSDGQGIESSPYENRYKILKTNDSQDRRKPHSETSTSCDSQVQVFDLRSKIQHSKSRSMGHNLQQADAPCPMDWEISYSAALAVAPQEAAVNSPPSQERKPKYRKIYLVFDTSALVSECDFVETLLVKGSYLGLPLTVVIPFVVFDELDGLKKSEVAFSARKISRVIQESDADKHLYIQEGDKKREAVGSLELRVNDDLVLNCCLQMREKCGENELAVLMTTDINLHNKAKSFKLPSYNCQTFKKWARGMREYKIPSLFSPHSSKQVSPGKMSVDESCEDGLEKRGLHNTENETMVLDGTVSNDQKTEDSIPSSENSSQLKIIIQSHVEELKTDFQGFLHTVLEEASEKEYGNLKKFASNIKPSWTILDYICEVKRRWFLLSGSSHPPEVERILHELLLLFKKHNSGKEELKVCDIDSLFRLSASITNIISKHSPVQANRFLYTLSVSKDDWKKACRSNVSPTNIVGNRIDDVQPVDIALQQIYQCSFSDYEVLERESDINQKTLEQLSAFFGKIADVLYVMNKIFEEDPDALTVNNEYVLQLHKIITFFSDVKGNPMGFEIVVENVVELFQEKVYRNSTKQLIEKFGDLEKLINILIDRRVEEEGLLIDHRYSEWMSMSK